MKNEFIVEVELAAVMNDENNKLTKLNLWLMKSAANAGAMSHSEINWNIAAVAAAGAALIAFIYFFPFSQ